LERIMARRKPTHFALNLFTFILFLSSWIAAFAQDSPQQSAAATPKDETCSIEGTVVAAARGEPLRGARLMLSPIGQGKQHPEPKFGTTDGEGRFLITGVAAGTYHFLTAKNGYVKQAYRPDGTEGSETILNLAAGQKLEKVVFRLKLAPVILGRITDENGEPVAGVQVEALVSQAKSAEGLQVPFLRGQWIPVKTAATNDLGEYRIYGLSPGSYYVAAIDSGFPELAEAMSLAGGSTGFVVSSGIGVSAAFGNPSINHATVYYPGVAQRSQAQKIRVRAGQEMRVDFALMGQKTVTVSGYVIGSNGKPSPQTMVRLRSQNLETIISSLRTMGSTDEHGHFAIKGVPQGSYFVSATVADHEGKTVSAEQPLEVGSEDVSLRLHLTGGIEISGKVIVTSRSKVDLGQLQIALSPSQGFEQFGFAEVKQDRTFTISNIHPGTYGLQLSGLPEGWYVSSADFGGENVLENGLKLGEAGGSHPLVVTVRSGIGKIEGTVLKGDDPVSGAAVNLIPEHPSPYRSDLVRTTATDQRGHFVILDVVPGKYRALAATREDNESDDDSDEPAAGDSSGTNIEVGEGESKNVQLKLHTGQ
jgi:protocatechuate 3,4-dioxygenase beta subunit